MVSGEALACSPPPPPPPWETAEQTARRQAEARRAQDDWDRGRVQQSRVVYVGRIVSVRTPQPEDATTDESVVVIASTGNVLRGSRPPRRLRVTDAYAFLCGPKYMAVPRAEDAGREVLIVLGDQRWGRDELVEMAFVDDPAAQRLLGFVDATAR